MTVYYVDDGGSDTAPYDTWAKAATSLSALDDAVAIASGDIIYIGHDHVCQFAHTATRTITGPSSPPPAYIISVTQGSDPPEYQKSSTDQVDTSEGAYQLTVVGNFVIRGVRFKAGSTFSTSTNAGHNILFEECTIAVGPNYYPAFSRNAQSLTKLVNCTFDYSADGTTPRTTWMLSAASLLDINGLTLANPEYRTGYFALMQGAHWRCSGADFSNLNPSCELLAPAAAVNVAVTNCKLLASQTFLTTGAPYTYTEIMFTNCGESDDPTQMLYAVYGGYVTSNNAIYRSGGATIEDINVGWLLTTASTCSESYPLKTPWIYGVVPSTGSKTFTVHITNDTADFLDNEVWLEVEYLGTANEPGWVIVTDYPVATDTGIAQTDDTSSTWVGTGPSFTYKQSLAVTATVNEEGQYRARVGCNVPSIASSRYFYVDPKVTVTA